MIYKYTIKLMMRHLNEQYEDRGNILFDTLRYQTLSEKTTFMKLKNVEEELVVNLMQIIYLTIII